MDSQSTLPFQDILKNPMTNSEVGTFCSIDSTQLSNESHLI